MAALTLKHCLKATPCTDSSPPPPFLLQSPCVPGCAVELGHPLPLPSTLQGNCQEDTLRGKPPRLPRCVLCMLRFEKHGNSWSAIVWDANKHHPPPLPCFCACSHGSQPSILGRVLCGANHRSPRGGWILNHKAGRPPRLVVRNEIECNKGDSWPRVELSEDAWSRRR
jgi:hypothetical protein